MDRGGACQVAPPALTHPPGAGATNALEKTNIAILLATISYIIAINNILTRVDQIEPALRWFIAFLTSVGLFPLLIVLIYRIVRSSDTSGDLQSRALLEGPLDLPSRGQWRGAYEHLATCPGSFINFYHWLLR